MKTNALSTLAALIIMCASARAAPIAVSGRWAAQVPSFVSKRVTGPDAPVEQASIDGEWTGEVPRGGSRFIAADFQFHVHGSTLTGRVHALDDDFPLTNATIAGSRLAFNIGETKGDFTGELSGDTIRMKVKYSGGENGRQTLDFVLTRVKR